MVAHKDIAGGKVINRAGKGVGIAWVDLLGESTRRHVGRRAMEYPRELVQPASRAAHPNHVVRVIGEYGGGGVISVYSRTIPQPDGCHARSCAIAIRSVGDAHQCHRPPYCSPRSPP